ncbi:uncharacterized protein LOC110441200 [Mizuhopecten yessoensis]|nr:uncharacterized protein LOC110441200 [Mizuhopecten yessoensis]XP_021339981.1 uncharacterized protein LOC110441200 [Mizuhopecten yessoensis]
MATSITGSNDSVRGKDAASETEIDDEHDLPLDYELNVTLDKIAQKLTDKDLDRMKFVYSGECGLGRRVQEIITTPLQFFDHMKRSRRLDRNNLLHVQALLWNLGKTDLNKIFVKFARQCDRAPLHFFSNDIDEGDTERSPVSFHISGVATDRRQIQKLQGLLAKLLVTPEATIFLNGVQPFHSIVVTFLIPNSAVAILKDLTSEEKGLLQQCDVDCVFIGEFKIRIKDEKFEIPEKLNERDEVKKLLNWNKQLQKNLEDTETRLIHREKELQRAVSGSEKPDKSQCIYKRSISGSKTRIRRASSHYDVLNEISLRLSDEHRKKLSEGYTFTLEELDHLQLNKHHVLRVLVDKDIKVDIRNRVLKLLRKLDEDSILQEAVLYLSKFSETDIDLVEEPTFDEEPDPKKRRIISN